MAVDDVRSGFRRSWSDLASVGRNTAGGYDRFAWTRTDHDLREWFAGEASAPTRPDDRPRREPVGLVGRSVCSGRGSRRGHRLTPGLGALRGAFDGPLGVVSSLLAVRSSGPRATDPTVRWPSSTSSTRRVPASGGLRWFTYPHRRPSPERAPRPDRRRWNDNGRRVGRCRARPTGPRLGSGPRGRIGAFVELHVEQGRALDDVHANVGVGSHIWPHGRWRIDARGSQPRRHDRAR